MKKEELPNIIPIFPLSNFIIFPKTTVPLNIFEPRYIEMINNSMRTNKFIGMREPLGMHLCVTHVCLCMRICMHLYM